MPATDYVPANDAEFLAWSTNFFAVLNANLATVGLVATDVTPITTAQAAYSTSVGDQVTKQAALDGAIATKKTRRTAYEPPLRALVKRIQAHPGMTDGLRAQLGITVPSKTRRRKSPGPELPLLRLEPRPSQVVVHFELKPAWALGCNIYRKKAGEVDFSLIAFDTATPYIDTITGPAINVSYRAAFRGSRDTDEGGFCPEQTVAAGG